MSLAKKKWFLICIVSAVILLPGEVDLLAEEMKKLVLIETMPVPSILEHEKWFRKFLSEEGFVEGENISIVQIDADGNYNRAEKLLREEIKKGRPDIVVTIATLASQAAKIVLSDTGIPQFFFQVSDPVGAGIIETIGTVTGSNLSGRVYTVPRDVRLDLVTKLINQTVIGRPVRIGYIHSAYPSSKGDIRELLELSKDRQDIIFLPYEVEYRSVPAGIPEMLKDVKKGINSLSRQIDFWWEPLGPLGELPEYTDLLLRESDIPIAVGNHEVSIGKGALINITPDIRNSAKEAAQLVSIIIRGEDAGRIPVTYLSSFKVSLNLKTALQLNIIIPPDILELAGDNTFR